MRATELIKVAYAVSFSAMLACSSGDTVVAANILSSNDTQYNGDTKLGALGGLLDPGIPDSILHPTDLAASTTPHQAVKVRITITQGSALSATADVTPVKAMFSVNVLDASGMPVLDANQKPTVVMHSAIAQSYDRITLTSAWNDGPAQVTAQALDAAGMAFFSAVPSTIQLKKGQATAAFLDFKIPSPTPPATPDGAQPTTPPAAGRTRARTRRARMAGPPAMRPPASSSTAALARTHRRSRLARSLRSFHGILSSGPHPFWCPRSRTPFRERSRRGENERVRS